MQNGICVDIDECALNPKLCKPGVCKNMNGSYTCECPDGYHLKNGACVGELDDKKVLLVKMEPKWLVVINKKINYLHVFADIDECSMNSYLCHGKGRACVNTEPSYKCVCQKGFRKVGDGCEDIDECATPNVCQHGNCSNSVGSYSCACNKGFVFRNGRCEGAYISVHGLSLYFLGLSDLKHIRKTDFQYSIPIYHRN